MKVEMKNGNKYERHYSFNGLMALLKRRFGSIGGDNPAVIKLDGVFYYVKMNLKNNIPYLELDGKKDE